MVTFAVAAYNVERFIDACLASILTQADDGCEVLVIDDGSADRTGRLCDAWAERDTRVRVLHQQNRGIVAVRNRCIEEARGGWISFVDGDDLLVQGAYRTLLEHTAGDFDAVYFDMQIFMDKCAVPKYPKNFRTREFRGEEVRGLRLSSLYAKNGTENYGSLAFRSVCAKAFRTDFLRQNQLRLQAGLVYAEDITFNMTCLRAYRAVKLVQCPFYLYRRWGDSTVSRYDPEAPARYSRAAQELKALTDGDAEMLARYYMNCISEIRSVLFHDTFHKSSRKPRSLRREDLRRLLSSPWCREALEKVDRSGLKKTDRAFCDLLTDGGFRRLSRYFAGRHTAERLKLLANRTGLARLLRPARNALRRIRGGSGR